MAMRSFSLLGLLGLSGFAAAAAGINDFDWDSITPSRKLEYHPCYEELQCARLVVPLDWLDDTNPHTVAVAIAKLPAKVPDDDPAFGGTIFTNPGGPGGSGIGFLLREGHILQDVADGNRSYEILSWDPRGVGFTSPKADCYGDIATRDVAELQEKAIGPLDASEDALKRHWARTQAYGKLCADSAVNGSILPFLTTPSVVRDMVAILDEIHELRDTESRSAEATDGGDGQKRLELRKADVPRIQYWGFSYGSILGNTFASMEPGRVGRLIIDGISNANDYMAGTWLKNLQDTEKIVEYFYKSCFEAGDKCALRKPSDSKWEDLRTRVDDFKAQVADVPISVFNDKRIVVISATEILTAFRRPVYDPLKSFARLGQVLSDALEGNYTLLLEDIDSVGPKLHDVCSLQNSSTIATISDKDASHNIMCGDGEDATKLGLPYFRDYIQELKGQSETLGWYWATIRFACSGLAIRPKWRFTGPFTTPEHDASIVEGRPAAPLLFFSTRLDPVTPLRNAVAMAENHPGAAWVVQESTGHCALSTPSECSKKIVQEYLEFGTVPESGTSCQPDCDPWNPCEEDKLAMKVNIAEHIA
ncbi:hypothetical protein JX265_000526 [Neoarthrinium moseri]|uniref:Peptidase S33 tripeptidyl aminopeptidase-like C-terminal domain-containing protein n=1 Tax=Neoarthrinium moseri TaxID=1658444 RepID=A0A9Q0AWZ2_9PEZI|nr:hypothetical protein JX265_000526 [Neoarthrinium moseri]